MVTYRAPFFQLLSPFFNVYNETSSNVYFEPLLDEKFRVLVLVLKSKTIVEHHITYLPKCQYFSA